MFKVDGVTGVYLGADFVSVTKSGDDDWHLLKPAVLGAIMEHYLSGDPVALDGAQGSATAVATARGRPDRAPDQGADRDSGAGRPWRRTVATSCFMASSAAIVYLHLRGACSGCPSSIVTLKNGIENLLKYYVPEVVEVRAIS